MNNYNNIFQYRRFFVVIAIIFFLPDVVLALSCSGPPDICYEDLTVSCSVSPSSVIEDNSVTLTSVVSSSIATPYKYEWSLVSTGQVLATSDFLPAAQSFVYQHFFNVPGSYNLKVKAQGRSVGGVESYGFCQRTVTVTPKPQCSNLDDDDNDGATDMGDSGCSSPTDNTEGRNMDGDRCTENSQCLSGYCDNNNTCYTRPPFNAQCHVEPSVTEVGKPVLWSVAPFGGTGTYTYDWEGYGPGSPPYGEEYLIHENERVVEKIYNIAGTKYARVIVNDGEEIYTAGCPSVNVQVPPKPLIVITGGPASIAYEPVGATLNWSVSRATNCTASWGEESEVLDIDSQSEMGAGTKDVTLWERQSTRTFTIACTGRGGTNSVTKIIPWKTVQCVFDASPWTPSDATCKYGETQRKTFSNPTPSYCTPKTKAPQTKICTSNKPPTPPLKPGLVDPLGGATIMEFIAKALRTLISILIPIIVIFYIITGLMFIAARGNPAKLALAKKSFLFTTIGAGVILGAWALAQMISSTINTLK